MLTCGRACSETCRASDCYEDDQRHRDARVMLQGLGQLHQAQAAKGACQHAVQGVAGVVRVLVVALLQRALPVRVRRGGGQRRCSERPPGPLGAGPPPVPGSRQQTALQCSAAGAAGRGRGPHRGWRSRWAWRLRCVGAWHEGQPAGLLLQGCRGGHVHKRQCILLHKHTIGRKGEATAELGAHLRHQRDVRPLAGLHVAWCRHVRSPHLPVTTHALLADTGYSVFHAQKLYVLRMPRHGQHFMPWKELCIIAKASATCKDAAARPGPACTKCARHTPLINTRRSRS